MLFNLNAYGPADLCRPVLGLVLLAGMAAGAQSADPPAAGFADPPPEARLRAYWWWLNGNVTKAAITRDLEEMAAKGFGGALICDAGGADQDGNDPVPHGPTFFTPEWRELYRHALREADRLGLEMSLNIQSGWNLGGPMIKPEDAPKRLVWSEIRVTGPAKLNRKLPEPQHPAEFYRDVAVVAYPLAFPSKSGEPEPPLSMTASSAQGGRPATLAVDQDEETFWVSRGTAPGQGPSRESPEWLQVDVAAPIDVDGISLLGRRGYGPRECELQVWARPAGAGRPSWRTVATLTAVDREECVVRFEQVRSSRFRLVMFSSFDPLSPDRPRNVQVAELRLIGPDRSWPAGRPSRHLRFWEQKALHKVLGRSAPDTTPLLAERPAAPGEEDLHSRKVVELSARLAPGGSLAWDVPEGEWEILRFGCTLNQHCRVSTCSDGWRGYALDPFDAGALRGYWRQIVEPLIDDAGPLAGRVLKYLHTDSWEVEVANWTPSLRQEFHARRGYDLIAFLPALAGRIVDNREISNRFLHDLRKTMGDLAVDNHFRLFSEWAHEHGLLLHPESGGPHAVPIDSLRCLGVNDAPMSEFWARSWRHRVRDEDRFFVKQPASAAHTYGHRLVLAEGFTTIGPHWQETLWDNLKPSFNRAACEGLNRLVWHAFTCSPAEMGLPGQEYFAGTHFNPNSTWWDFSAPFLAYINRCQFLLQQGLLVADAVYYYGDHVPNFAQLKASDPARVLPGYDYDVATEEVVLTRMSVRDGQIVLPDGMSYRVLVLPEHERISLPVLRKIERLVSAGATVIGEKPRSATGLRDYPACDKEVIRLAGELWGNDQGDSAQDHAAVERRHGAGRVISGRTARQVLQADGVPPDFEYANPGSSTSRPVAKGAAILDYIHRRSGETDIYFVCNRTGSDVAADVSFRVDGKAPELWDPLTGRVRGLPAFCRVGARTVVPLEFTPFGSWFVLFRSDAASTAPQVSPRNFDRFSTLNELVGPWTVRFDPQWGGPASIEFPVLADWTQHPSDGIRFYSGRAVYEKTFQAPALPRGRPVYLNLGRVRDLARVRLNGRDLGVVWSMPSRVDITEALQPADNSLQIEVVNLWPNRIIGDQHLTPNRRRTRTNIHKLTKDTPLTPSGLLGPVTLELIEYAEGAAL